MSSITRDGLVKLADRLLSCTHRRKSRPMSLSAAAQGAADSGTYVVCLDCGRRIPYDWDAMRISGGAMDRARRWFGM